MSSMRVAHLDTERVWRGGQGQVYYLARGLNQRGIDTFIVAPPDAPLIERARSSGIRAYPLRMRGEWDLLAASRLARLLRAEQVDILHLHTAHAVTLGIFAGAIAGVSVRVATRRVDIPPRGHWLARWRYTHGVVAVACISPAVRATMLAIGVPPERLQLIYSGIDTQRFVGADRTALRDELGLKPDAPLIVNVAALTPHKGQRHLIDALPLIRQRFPDVQLAIAGDGELRQVLPALARQRGVASCVHMLGHRDDIPNILAAADVFVITSTMEGLCTSLLDAMAVGVPVVGTAVGGIPEVIEDGRSGCLVPPGDTNALAKAICEQLAPGPNRDQMIARGRERLQEHFTVDRMIDRYVALYEHLVSERGTAARIAPCRTAKPPL